MTPLSRREFLKVAASAGACALISNAHCAGAAQGQGKITPLLEDPAFRRGLIVWDPKPGKHVRQGDIVPPDASPAPPVWGMAQWSSRFTPAGAKPEGLDSGAVCFADGAKAVTFGPAGSDQADLILEYDTRKEYGDRLRQKGEPWPHLLVSQPVASSPALVSLARLRFHVECRLLRAREHRREGWSRNLHAAQFLGYLSVQNRNRQSAGYGDFMWFGIPIYDSRERFVKPHFAPDQAHKKFIYSPGQTAYTDQSAHDGGWVAIDRDLAPLIREGLEAAWSRGHLAQSREIGDFRITAFSLGWELPGTVDVAMQTRGLSLEAGHQ